jgi:transcription elongation factor GreA
MQKLAKIQLSTDYYEKIQQRYTQLQAYREEVLVRLQDAREKGDLKENGAYTAARFELSDTDRELRKLSYLLRYGVATEAKQTEQAGFGNTVTVRAGTVERAFTLVSRHEADPRAHKLSVESPLGRQLVGKKMGDSFEVEAPAGTVTYRVIKIE